MEFVVLEVLTHLKIECAKCQTICSSFGLNLINCEEEHHPPPLSKIQFIGIYQQPNVRLILDKYKVLKYHAIMLKSCPA